MTSPSPYCFVSREIPPEERQRVFVTGYGFGITKDRITLMDAVHGVGVQFESGLYQTVAPAQIGNPPTLHRVHSNVILFRPRAS
jgi:hypothetical protein